MNITIASAFRDSDIEAYQARCYSLSYPADKLRFICVEGDSVDGTWADLTRWATNDNRVQVIKFDTKLPRHGSVINLERLSILAQTFNKGLDAIDLSWSDYVLFTPSDVIWEPSILEGLLNHNKDMIAAWFWTYNINHVLRFYDTWAFCYQGQYFEQWEKSWFDEKFPGVTTLEMDTVGGCVLMKKEIIASGCRYTEAEVDRGLSKMAKEKGFEVWAALDTWIIHP